MKLTKMEKKIFIAALAVMHSNAVIKLAVCARVVAIPAQK